MGDILSERIYVKLDGEGDDQILMAYNDIKDAIDAPGLAGATNVATYQKISFQRLTKQERVLVHDGLGNLISESDR